MAPTWWYKIFSGPQYFQMLWHSVLEECRYIHCGSKPSVPASWVKFHWDKHHKYGKHHSVAEGKIWSSLFSVFSCI